MPVILKIPLVFLLVPPLFLTSCMKVEPWQKGNLAKSHMAFDPDPLEAQFMQHVYKSKEASSGGYGVGGGGCGCN